MTVPMSKRLRDFADIGFEATRGDVRRWADEIAALEAKCAAREAEADELGKEADRYAKECGEAWGIKKKWADRAEAAEALAEKFEAALRRIAAEEWAGVSYPDYVAEAVDIAKEALAEMPDKEDLT